MITPDVSHKLYETEEGYCLWARLLSQSVSLTDINYGFCEIRYEKLAETIKFLQQVKDDIDGEAGGGK